MGEWILSIGLVVARMPPLNQAISRTRPAAALGLRTTIIAAAIVAMAVLVGLSLTGSHAMGRHDRLETADQLYQQLTLAREEHAQAVVDLEAARAYAATAKTRQQNFLTAQMSQQPVVESETVEPTQRVVSAAPVMATNPAWADLTVRLNELNAVRAGMLERYTVEHPEVRYLDVQISDLDRSRSAVPELIPAPQAPATAMPQPSAEQQASLERARREQIRVAALQELVELQRQSDQAQLKLHTAESAESRAMARVASLAARVSQITEPKLQPSTVQPATVWTLVGLVAVLAVLGCATIALGQSRTVPTFRSVFEVEQELGLPVVGVLSVGATLNDDSEMLQSTDFSEEEVLV